MTETSFPKLFPLLLTFWLCLVSCQKDTIVDDGADPKLPSDSTTQMSPDSIDLFPLERGIRYTYSYSWRYSSYSAPSGTNSLHHDSGTVVYVVDSFRIDGSLRNWYVTQSEHLIHHLRDSATYPTPSVNESFSTTDSVFLFVLEESMDGAHELTCTSRIWNFPIVSSYGTSSVHRFDSLSVRLIYQGTPPPFHPPDWNDRWYFNSEQGLFRREYLETSIHNSGYSFSRSYILLALTKDGQATVARRSRRSSRPL